MSTPDIAIDEMQTAPSPTGSDPASLQSSRPRPVAASPGQSHAAQPAPAAQSPDKTTTPAPPRSADRNLRLRNWLPGYCAALPGLTRAYLFVPRDGAPGITQIASWPQPGACPAALGELAGLALSGRPRATRIRTEKGWLDRLVVPVTHGNDVLGSLACEAENLSSAQREELLKKFGYAGGDASESPSRQKAEPNHQLEIVIDLFACCLDAPRAQAARMSLVTEAAARLGCDRVSLGRYEDHQVQLQAMSHSARIDRRSNLVRLIEGAMNEAAEQGATVVYPRRDRDAVDREHEALARESGNAHLVTIPLASAGAIVGALSFERHGQTPFDDSAITLCESLGAVAGPLLELRHRDERGLVAHAADTARHGVGVVVGRRHTGTKLLVSIVAGIAAWMALAHGTYRVSAPATLEGRVHRAVVAPVDGFVASAGVRAGDQVVAEQVLARLDDRELSLELSRWNSELSQLRKQHRSAMAAHDRARTSILKTQIARAEAQLSLLQTQLSRTELRAPLSGVVVSGDLSQLLGSPVQRGEVLFEIAPLADYRVVLEIDERDVSALQVGLSGQIALEGLPNQRLNIVVEKITPVSVARDGRNFFQVEARLDDTVDALRPGMAGVAKVIVGERRLIWIWTHRIVDWLKLRLWRWQP